MHFQTGFKSSIHLQLWPHQMGKTNALPNRILEHALCTPLALFPSFEAFLSGLFPASSKISSWTLSHYAGLVARVGTGKPFPFYHLLLLACNSLFLVSSSMLSILHEVQIEKSSRKKEKMIYFFWHLAGCLSSKVQYIKSVTPVAQEDNSMCPEECLEKCEGVGRGMFTSRTLDDLSGGHMPSYTFFNHRNCSRVGVHVQLYDTNWAKANLI